MAVRHTVTRLLVPVPFIVAAGLFVSTGEPVRGIDLGASRLVSSERLPESMAESCTWEAAAP